ncbi:MAG: tRNA (guanosine(37)-N1)-methyltransferase TrmD, partial [Candidatus Sumerlaeaceae bacterium]
MIIEILTLFPEMFGPVVGSSMLKRAQERGIAAFRVRNIRDFTTDKHHVADDTPYGGGPGMVLKPEPIAAAIDTVMAENSPTPLTRVYLTPDGEPWTQKLAEEFAQLPGIMLLCGHYEGVDQRIRDHFIDREISIGDYVLTGGEIPAMVVIDSVVRLLPGALGNAESARHDSFSGEGLLDYPHYTRPPVFRGHG